MVVQLKSTPIERSGGEAIRRQPLPNADRSGAQQALQTESILRAFEASQIKAESGLFSHFTNRDEEIHKALASSKQFLHRSRLDGVISASESRALADQIRRLQQSMRDFEAARDSASQAVGLAASVAAGVGITVATGGVGLLPLASAALGGAFFEVGSKRLMKGESYSGKDASKDMIIGSVAGLAGGVGVGRIAFSCLSRAGSRAAATAIEETASAAIERGVRKALVQKAGKVALVGSIDGATGGAAAGLTGQAMEAETWHAGTTHAMQKLGMATLKGGATGLVVGGVVAPVVHVAAGKVSTHLSSRHAPALSPEAVVPQETCLSLQPDGVPVRLNGKLINGDERLPLQAGDRVHTGDSVYSYDGKELRLIADGVPQVREFDPVSRAHEIEARSPDFDIEFCRRQLVEHKISGSDFEGLQAAHGEASYLRSGREEVRRIRAYAEMTGDFDALHEFEVKRITPLIEGIDLRQGYLNKAVAGSILRHEQFNLREAARPLRTLLSDLKIAGLLRDSVDLQILERGSVEETSTFLQSLVDSPQEVFSAHVKRNDARRYADRIRAEALVISREVEGFSGNADDFRAAFTQPVHDHELSAMGNNRGLRESIDDHAAGKHLNSGEIGLLAEWQKQEGKWAPKRPSHPMERFMPFDLPVDMESRHLGFCQTYKASGSTLIDNVLWAKCALEKAGLNVSTNNTDGSCWRIRSIERAKIDGFEITSPVSLHGRSGFEEIEKVRNALAGVGYVERKIPLIFDLEQVAVRGSSFLSGEDRALLEHALEGAGLLGRTAEGRAYLRYPDNRELGAFRPCTNSDASYISMCQENGLNPEHITGRRLGFPNLREELTKLVWANIEDLPFAPHGLLYRGHAHPLPYWNGSSEIGRLGLTYATPNPRYAKIYTGAIDGESATRRFYTPLPRVDGRYVGFMSAFEDNGNVRFRNFGLEDGGFMESSTPSPGSDVEVAILPVRNKVVERYIIWGDRCAPIPDSPEWQMIERAMLPRVDDNPVLKAYSELPSSSDDGRSSLVTGKTGNTAEVTTGRLLLSADEAVQRGSGSGKPQGGLEQVASLTAAGATGFHSVIPAGRFLSTR